MSAGRATAKCNAVYNMPKIAINGRGAARAGGSWDRQLALGRRNRLILFIVPFHGTGHRIPSDDGSCALRAMACRPQQPAARDEVVRR